MSTFRVMLASKQAVVIATAHTVAKVAVSVIKTFTQYGKRLTGNLLKVVKSETQVQKFT